jgi:DNA-binding winged helix-turn-helix (wHTH) protein
MAAETSVHFGSFRLDSQNACVWRGEEMIKLTPKALAVLCYLVEHPGRLVTREELFTARNCCQRHRFVSLCARDPQDLG